MKQLIVLLCLLGGAKLLAQAPFTGGQGDGYSKVSLSNVQVSLEDRLKRDWQVYPQPLRQGEELQLAFSSPISSSLTLQLLTIQGKMCWKQGMKEGEKEQRIPTKQLSPGVYLLWVIGEDTKTGEKIIILE